MIVLVCGDCGAGLVADDMRVATRSSNETIYFCPRHMRVRRVETRVV